MSLRNLQPPQSAICVGKKQKRINIRSTMIDDQGSYPQCAFSQWQPSCWPRDDPFRVALTSPTMKDAGGVRGTPPGVPVFNRLLPTVPSFEMPPSGTLMLCVSRRKALDLSIEARVFLLRGTASSEGVAPTTHIRASPRAASSHPWRILMACRFTYKGGVIQNPYPAGHFPGGCRFSHGKASSWCAIGCHREGTSPGC